jgi:hypothetical protein
MKKIYYLIFPAAAFLLAFLARSLYHYSGFYSPPDVPASQPDSVQVLSEPLGESLVSVESLTPTILVDTSHANRFDEEELSVLFGRIAAAGGRVVYHGFDDDLRQQLRSTGTFVVIANDGDFDANDMLAIDEFVRKGGRLLLIGEPTRLDNVNDINALAGQYGIIYQEDYIYNLVENDHSYLNVILRDFAASDLTAGLDEIVFQGAQSLRVAEGALVMGDENTYSSLREQPGDVTAVALTTNGQVLALPDLTFLTGPYNTFADNDLFIKNIVSFLLGAERSFELLDFPYFFSETADLIYSDTDLLDSGFEDSVRLRQALADIGVQSLLTSALGPDQPLIYIGLYDDITTAAFNALQADGVGIGASDITLEGVGDFSRFDSALIHLHRTDGGLYQLYILADSQDSLANGMAVLLDGRLAECLLSSTTALCRSSMGATPPVTPTPFDDFFFDEVTPTPTASG